MLIVNFSQQKRFLTCSVEKLNLRRPFGAFGVGEPFFPGVYTPGYYTTIPPGLPFLQSIPDTFISL